MFKEIGVIALFTVPAIVYDPPSKEVPQELSTGRYINVRITNKADVRYTTYEQCPIIDNEARC